jgi:hypothetical protein
VSLQPHHNNAAAIDVVPTNFRSDNFATAMDGKYRLRPIFYAGLYELPQKHQRLYVSFFVFGDKVW